MREYRINNTYYKHFKGGKCKGCDERTILYKDGYCKRCYDEVSNP